MSLPPFHQDGYVYFELTGPDLFVFEPGSKGGRYSVPGFSPGLYRLHVDAIRRASPEAIQRDAEGLIYIDRAQMFFVDQTKHQQFEQAFDETLGSVPNYEYFERLRSEIQTDFGYLVAGAEPAEELRGDGVYILDLSLLERVGPSGSVVKDREISDDELYISVARSMKTYVCSVCYENELMIGSGDTEHYRAAAEEARRRGWRITPDPGPFGDFSVLCPGCARSSTV